MCRALVLSELTGVGLKIGTPSSRRCQCQITSLLAEDIDLYLVSADDLETMVCFLHFKEIVRSQMMQSSMSRESQNSMLSSVIVRDATLILWQHKIGAESRDAVNEEIGFHGCDK